MSETQSPCVSCQRPKAQLRCGLCEERVCKRCVQEQAGDAFSFLSPVPPALAHLSYCPACYDREVAPARDRYDETMELARGVYFFFTTQKRHIHLIRKAPQAVKVENCPDRDETILRLAFRAAQGGYNAIIEGEVTSEKVRNEGWQTSRWRGRGVPALVDAAKLDRDDALE